MILHRTKGLKKESPFAFAVTLTIICMLFFLRDNMRVSVSQSMLLLLFSIGILFFRRCDFIALGVCIPLFCNGIQTMALIFIALIIYCGKFGVRYIKKSVVLVIALMAIEAVNGMFNSKTVSFDLLQYGRHVASFLFMGFILDGLDETDNKEVAFVMKAYSIVYTFTMIDILMQFTNRYGSINAFVVAGIRLGNATTGLEGTYNVLFNNANMIGLYSVLAIATCVSLIFQSQSKKNVVWFAIAFFALYCGLTSSSRTFLATFLILAIFVLWSVFKDRTQKPLAKFLLVVASVIIGIIATMTIFSASIDSLLARFSTNRSTEERNTLLHYYNHYMFEHPEYWLFGIGLQGVMTKTSAIGVPHNAIQETFVCTGICGLIIIILLIRNILLIAKKKHQFGKLSISNLLIFIAYFAFVQFIQFVRLPEVYLLLILVACGLSYNYSNRAISGGSL